MSSGPNCRFELTPSSSAARCQGLPDRDRRGSRGRVGEELLDAATTAAASVGSAAREHLDRGRGGFRFPLPDTRGPYPLRLLGPRRGAIMP